MKPNIYITGLGFFTPLGYGKEETLTKLRNGESGLKVKSLWDGIQPCLIGDLPDVPFDEHIDWKELFRPTLYSQILILSCYDAIKDAKIDDDYIESTGCVMETCLGPSESVNEYMKDLLLIKKGLISPMKFTRTVSNTALGDVSRYFKLKGPSCILLTESSVSYAHDLIRLGMADIVICSAVDMVTKEVVMLKGHDGELLYTEENVERMQDSGSSNVDAWASGCCTVILESEESMKRRGVSAYARLASCQEKFGVDATNDSRPAANTDRRFCGNMLYASTVFELAVACLSLKYGESYHVGEKSHKEYHDEVVVSSERDGGMNSLFIIDNK
jgi:3-oxoacyl-(acyl-carrier-protein) synthase